MKIAEDLCGGLKGVSDAGGAFLFMPWSDDCTRMLPIVWGDFLGGERGPAGTIGPDSASALNSRQWCFGVCFL